MAGERPSLGFEYEVALAKVDLTTTLAFNESPYPTISGSFVVLTCTRSLRLVPPAQRVKFIACGYNPAAQIIPAATTPGSLSFSLSDRAQTNQAMTYHGSTCVARVITRLDNEVVRTQYCGYYQPSVSLGAEDGDAVGEITVDGPFSILR